MFINYNKTNNNTEIFPKINDSIWLLYVYFVVFTWFVAMKWCVCASVANLIKNKQYIYFLKRNDYVIYSDSKTIPFKYKCDLGISTVFTTCDTHSYEIIFFLTVALISQGYRRMFETHSQINWRHEEKKNR